MTLDFVNVDVRDVVRSVLGDVLKLSYAIDPAVQGTVTLQTTEPVPRDSVLGVLDGALRMSSLAVVQGDGVYRIVPLANASRGIRIGGSSPSGIVARVITPRYVAAIDLQRVLEPMVPTGTSLRAEPSRNVLIISGPAPDVAALLDNLAIFDVDYMRGLSFAMLPLRAASARDVAKDVTGLLSTLGAGAGLVRVTAIERLNSILVTAMQPAYLDRVRSWVSRLDKGGAGAGQQLFVYRVQNGRAGDLAGVLRKAYGIATTTDGGQSGTGQSADSGDTATGPGTDAPNPAGPAAAGGGTNPLLGGVPAQTPGAGQMPQGVTAAPNGAGSNPRDASSDIRITADETNNALLIMASQEEYTTLEATLRQLDLPPLQVMIEATVAEVTLTNQLALGLQYYIRSGNFQAQLAQTESGSTNTSFSGFNFAQGLNFAYGTLAGSSVILQLLQQLTTVHVLSSPNLLVLNNQSARIQVGDQVPIATGSAQSTLASGAPIVNSIEYRDTGVILKVTPRVNASNMVSLDIAQEVSDVSSTTTSSLNSPTISERRLNSTVSVSDGQTVALGGLIKDSQTESKNGIPVLQDIPGLGWLFGTRTRSGTRTELIALITPHVIRDPFAARAITDELQRKLPLTLPVASHVQ